MTDPYAAFAPFYDAWTEHMPDDVDFFVRRAKETASPVVELGAGTGRVTVAMALAGAELIAVDASAAMLERGRARASEEGVSDRIRWVHEDMQRFRAAPPVELVVITGRSFQHLITVDEQLAALASIHDSLVPGGRVIFHAFIPDPRYMVEQEGARTVHRAWTDDDGRACELWSVATYDVVGQVAHVTAGFDVRRGEELLEQQQAPIELRLMYRYETEHLLARAGFEIESLYGWFDERPLTEESREMIWVARKP